MKKDKYEELKPEVFKYEDRNTPTILFGCITAILFMLAGFGLFLLFIWALFSTVPVVIEGM